MTLSDSVQILVDRLGHTDVDLVIESAGILASTKAHEAIPALREALKSTDQHGVRDAVAVALSDLGDEGCVPLIADLLTDPATSGHRGTLLYALQPFDNRPIFLLLIDLVITGGFEVRRLAFQNLTDIDAEIDVATWDSGLKRLQQALEDAPTDRRDLLLDLLDVFLYEE